MIHQRRKLVVGLVLVVGCAVSVAASVFVAGLEAKREQAQFAESASARISLVRQTVVENLEVVRSIVAFYNSTQAVERDEFRSFVAPALGRFRSFQALEWIPRVASSERLAVEEAARAEEYPEFRITERDSDGIMVPASPRAEYFPVYFVEPYEGNEAALGFDLASNPTRLAALQESRDSGEMRASGRITLVQETGEQFGFLVFAPVFRGGPRDSVDERRENLLGFALGVFRVSDMVAAALSIRSLGTRVQSREIDIRIYDEEAEGEQRLLLVHHSRLREAPGPQLTEPEVRSGINVTQTLKVGGREWSVVAIPVDPGLGGTAWQAWVVLVIGLAFTGLVAAYLVFVFRRLAEREAVEEERHETQFLLSAMTEGATDGIFIKDAEGRYRMMNTAGARLLGLNPEDVVGRDDAELFPHDRARSIAASDTETQASGKAVTVEESYMMGGVQRTFRTTKGPFHDAEGRVVGLIGIVRDVTERRQVEDALRESEGHLRATVDNVADAIVTIGEAGFIESFNPAAERVFGYARDEALGRNVKMLMPAPDRARHDGYLRAYLESGQPRIPREVVGRRKDGTPVPLEINVSDVRLGMKRLFIGVMRDISERKAVERMKDEFISTVSHELRTPLTSINASLGLIADGMAGDLSDDAAELFEIARNNADRLVRLINDVLDIQKIESGMVEYELRRLSITEIVDQAIESNRAFAEQFGVTFSLRDSAPHAQVMADGDRLAQVLTNLLSNATKFSPPDDTVDLAISRRDGAIRVAVSDHGPGIPEEFHTSVFKRFSQASTATGRQKGGTGLGLSICKAIMDGLGGRIGFDSIAGAGATFYFELPESHEGEARAGHDAEVSA